MSLRAELLNLPHQTHTLREREHASLETPIRALQKNDDPHPVVWVTYHCANCLKRSSRPGKSVTRALRLTSRDPTREHTQRAPSWPCVVRLPWVSKTAQLLPSSRRVARFLSNALQAVMAPGSPLVESAFWVCWSSVASLCLACRSVWTAESPDTSVQCFVPCTSHKATEPWSTCASDVCIRGTIWLWSPSDLRRERLVGW